MRIRLDDFGDVGRRQDTPHVSETDSRRRFLFGAVLALSSASPAVRILRSRHNVSPSWLRQLVPSLEPASAIGRRYLDAWPGEASRAWLVDRLFGAHLPDMRRAGELAWVRRQLRDRRSADFRSGDLVFVDGWALTRTEARLMALVALCATS